MEIDFGGIGKEYAADRAAAILSEAGITHAMVNLGGDIRTLATHPGGKPWRIGIVDPREGILTGMTRDGTFRIRDGKLAEPLVNLRFTVSVPELLADVPGLTRDVRLTNQTEFYDERYGSGALVPALATARFHVTGTGSAPGL